MFSLKTLLYKTPSVSAISGRRTICSSQAFNVKQGNASIYIDHEVTDPLAFPFEESEMDLKGRNSRPPKKANHGARPCSSVMRKLKRSKMPKRRAS
ncbi:unnamed protein product [Moneuplotes crassus]|uniref:Uncharacterized protein n=1 Tax=Euplotes crassus TaxID=5936 RepID=A0AAD2D7U6_EUPCR|nr:unnamed protein product [Moneuplotes crassus]